MTFRISDQRSKRAQARAKAEQLLRTGEYTAQQLVPLLGVSHTTVKALILDLRGEDRQHCLIYVSSWEVSRGITRIRLRPRFRWRLGGEGDRPAPSHDEYKAIMARQEASAAPIPSFTADPLMGGLFAGR